MAMLSLITSQWRRIATGAMYTFVEENIQSRVSCLTTSFPVIKVDPDQEETDCVAGSLDASPLVTTGPGLREISMAASVVHGSKLYGIASVSADELTTTVFGGQTVEPKVVDRGLRILTLGTYTNLFLKSDWIRPQSMEAHNIQGLGSTSSVRTHPEPDRIPPICLWWNLSNHKGLALRRCCC
jgi:hypothetical protein